MTSGLRAFLTHLIDYAGLFPPAALALDPALRNYARYREHPDAWMLSRFVCPAAKLKELAGYHDELFTAGPPFCFSVLGQGGSTTQEFAEAILSDFQCVKAFLKKHGRRVRVDSFEMRLPPGILQNVKSAPAVQRQRIVMLIATQADEVTADQGLPLVTTFFEVETGPQWQTVVGELMEVLREDPLRRRGFKLRCGGATAAALPTPAQVAEILDLCRGAGVPVKFTAGLHHPLRHFNAGLKAHMHGFFNVFGAGILAHAREVGRDVLQEIIADENAGNFQFDDTGLHWRHLHATTDEITAARRQLVTSVGSCSFDEPRDDLRTMGLLEQ